MTFNTSEAGAAGSAERLRQDRSDEREQAGDPRQNRLLAALPSVEWWRVQRYLEPVELIRGVMCEPGWPRDYAYFPISATVSLLGVEANGASTEIASVGNEGVLGIALLLGGETTPRHTIVLSQGWAYRIKGAILKREFNRNGALQQQLLLYTQALLTMTGQMAVCNRHHPIIQRMCRWLLLNLDRTESLEIMVTHQILASLLGVRREGITEAAGKLQTRQYISYHRGRIYVIDRTAVEASCCGCYSLIRREFDRSQHLSSSDAPRG
jgi:CRP-like cAMP-binding protein